MKVLKTFVRDGVKYRRGDPLPKGLDNPTVAKYERHGMVGELNADDVARQEGEGGTTTVIVRNGSARRKQVARVVELTGGVGQQAAPTNAQAPGPSNAATPNTPHGEGAGPGETNTLGGADDESGAGGDTGSGEPVGSTDASAGDTGSDAPTGDSTQT